MTPLTTIPFADMPGGRYTVTLWGVDFGRFISALDAMAWGREAFGLGLPWRWRAVS